MESDGVMRDLIARLEEGVAFGWHRPAEIQEALTKVYLAAHSLKADFDRMEGVPSYLDASYKATMKVLAELERTQKAAQDLYNQMRHAHKTTR